eukprot:SAG31_NODE_2113_length_6422_cov_2.860035_5_plen_200_part_00
MSPQALIKTLDDLDSDSAAAIALHALLEENRDQWNDDSLLAGCTVEYLMKILDDNLQLHPGDGGTKKPCRPKLVDKHAQSAGDVRVMLSPIGWLRVPEGALAHHEARARSLLVNDGAKDLRPTPHVNVEAVSSVAGEAVPAVLVAQCGKEHPVADARSSQLVVEMSQDAESVCKTNGLRIQMPFPAVVVEKVRMQLPAR